MAVNFRAEQLEHAKRALRGIPGGVEKAAVPAINRAIKAAKTAGTRKASKVYYQRQTDINRVTRVGRATRSNLSASFSSRSRKIPLYAFRVKPKQPIKDNPPELKVSVKKDTGFQTIKRAFVEIGRSSGNLNVFQRVGRERYPVRTLFGPSIPEMMGDGDVRGAVNDRAFEMLEQRFDHEIGRVLSKSMSR